MVIDQRSVKCDARAERQEGLVARMGMGRCRLETDSRSPDAERRIGRMVELQRFGQVKACARVPSADVVGVEYRSRADFRDGHGLNAVANGVVSQSDFVADGDVGDGGHLDVSVAGICFRCQIGLRARLANPGDRDHLILFHGIRNGRVSSAIAEAELLADLYCEAARGTEKAARAGIRHIDRAGGNCDDRTVGERLPQGRVVAGGCPEGRDFSGFHGGAGADLNRIADGHAGCAPDIDGGIAFLGRGRQPGVREAEQVKAVSCELRSGRDLHRRKDGFLSRVFGQGPAGEVNVAVAGVVKLDERVGRVRGEFINFDGADVPYLLGHGLRLRPAGRWVRPRGVANQIAVEGCRPRGDLEGCADTRARRDRVRERL